MPDVRSLARRNRVLAALPEAARRDLLDQLRPVELASRQRVFDRDRPGDDVYFPLTAMASLVVAMADGTVVECATVGNEGVVGLPVFPGSDGSPITCFTQVPGQALAMDVAAFHRAVGDTDGPLPAVLARYTQSLLSQLAQNVACNRLHSIEQRCARWLLLTADRVDAARFPLTQEFLAQMLGVRRAGVSDVARRLAATGSIGYHQGVIEIHDRSRLEATSCECYRQITAALDRMLDPAPHP